MRIEEVKVNSQGLGWDEALEFTEKLGLEGGLDKKELLQLRLLGEELIGLMRGIAGDMEALFRIEQKDRAFRLLLTSEITLTQEMRSRFLAVATSGENAAAKGFMGRIRDMIAAALLPKNEGPSVFTQGALGFLSMGSPTAGQAGGESYMWSLNKFRENVDNEEARQELEDLHKSIVASIADDVSVSVKGSDVEIVIEKAF